MRLFRCGFFACGLVTFAAAGVATGGLAPASAQASAPSRSLSQQTPEELKAAIESKHPAAYYALAKRLFEGGDKDEAVFWFYVGQIRFRSYLSSNPQLKPDGDPALFGALSEVIGRPINVYAFGDIAALASTIDRALAWDGAHVDGFAPKGPARDKVRAGLAAMKADVIANQDKYRAMREANGLENRTR